MKKIFIAIIICLIVSPFFAFAYNLLQPLPGLDEELPSSGGFTAYLTWIFRFALAAAAFLAVLQIVIGGIQYIMSGANEGLRKNAHDKITDALWGILLALAAWLILYTINPDLAKMKLEIPPIKVKGAEIGKGEFRKVDRNKLSATEARQIAADMGVGVKSECPAGVSKGCVKMEGVRQSTLDELANLREQVGADVPIYITGGAEGGHASSVDSHANGYKVDLRLNTALDKYITTNFEPGKPRIKWVNGKEIEEEKWINPKTGAVYVLELGKQPHWDVVR